MSEFDYFNSLKGKVHEMKVRRDDIAQDVMRKRLEQTSIEQQIADLERERQRLKLDIDQKEGQMKKFNELIDSSETALNKMIKTTMTLDDTLANALNNKL